MKELTIIGAGPGGYQTALYAANHDVKVTIYEESDLGGTCLNSGCIPTKTLLHEASQGATSLDEAMQRKDVVVSQLQAGIEQLLSHPNITLVREHADLSAILASRTLGSVIIATGSTPKVLPIEGADEPYVVTSENLLGSSSLASRPLHLVIIGAGVIGMEMACIYSAFGYKVTVVEYLAECLPVLDSDIAKRLRKTLEKRGIEFYMQSSVEKIADNVVFFSRKGKQQQVPADLVLMATGRAPRISGFGLENTAIEHSPRGIVVDENMQTSVPGVYAIGDVNARCMLAHAAEYQGRKAVNHMLGIKDTIRLDIMPSAVFTIPEAASVGLSEDQCKEQNIAHKVLKSFYRSNGKALAMNATDGMLKLMVSTDDDRLLGCHVYGAHAADIVQEVSVLMCCNATLTQLRDMVHIHPTLSEVLSAAL